MAAWGPGASSLDWDLQRWYGLHPAIVATVRLAADRAWAGASAGQGVWW